MKYEAPSAVAVLYEKKAIISFSGFDCPSGTPEHDDVTGDACKS